MLAVVTYDMEEEAIAIANDTIDGLAGGVWSADRARAPFGGYKGIGRGFGTDGLEEYFQIKAIQC